MTVRDDGGRTGRHGVLLVNPVAGNSSPGLVREVADRCLPLLGSLDVAYTEYPGHATGLARKVCEPGGVDVVVALGGDGTVDDVATGLATLPDPARRPALLPLAAGTGNSFYREVWNDRPWQQAVDEAFGPGGWHVRHVDMGQFAELDRMALLGASSGLSAEALAVAATLTGVTGRERYAQAVGILLRSYRPYPGRVVVDGAVVYEGPTVLANVGGGRHRAGRFMLLPHSVLDDGLLDVCVVGDLDLGVLAGLTAEGRHLERPEVFYARGRSVTVERTDGEPLAFEHDGQLLAKSLPRYTLDVVAGAVDVLAPTTR